MIQFYVLVTLCFIILIFSGVMIYFAIIDIKLEREYDAECSAKIKKITQVAFEGFKKRLIKGGFINEQT